MMKKKKKKTKQLMMTKKIEMDVVWTQEAG